MQATNETHTNGEVRDLDVDTWPIGPVVLSPVALRRLARLGAAVEGATDVAQAAINAHATRRTAYQQAFEAACGDEGRQFAPGRHDIAIDWTTGVVTFTPQQP
jgi:hypothetical protein